MSPRGFEAVGTPLCGLSVSSKSCCPATAPVCANTGAPLLGFRSPSAHDGIGYPYPGKVATTFPAPSVLGVSHPLDGLLHPNPCKALKQRLSCESRCVPAALLGFPVLFRSSGSCDPERATRVRVSSSRCSPPPRRTRCSPCPPFLRFVPSRATIPSGRRRRFENGRCKVSIAGESVFRAVASRSHQPSGGFWPTFTLASSNHLLALRGCPATFLRASPPAIPQLRRTFATLPFTASRACVTASDPTTNRVVEERNSRACASNAAPEADPRSHSALRAHSREPTIDPQSIHPSMNRAIVEDRIALRAARRTSGARTSSNDCRLPGRRRAMLSLRGSRFSDCWAARRGARCRTAEPRRRGFLAELPCRRTPLRRGRSAPPSRRRASSRPRSTSRE